MRQILVAFLMVSVVLSGCAEDRSDDDNGVNVTPTTSSPTAVALTASGNQTTVDWPVPEFKQRYVAERGAGEPTIAVNKNGVAIYPSIGFDAAVPALARTVVYRSTDGGDNWTYASPQLPVQDPVVNGEAQPISLDPYVYADPVTGRLFTEDLYLACSWLSWSDDDAQTWTTNPIACGVPVNDHQTLFTGPNNSPVPLAGYEQVIYYCNNQVADSLCTRSFDGGLTWIPGTPAYLGVQPGNEGNPVAPALCGGLHGHGHASQATGFVYLGKGHCGHPAIAVSEDSATTWTTVVINGATGMSPQDGHEVSVTTDAAGNVYAFWLDSDMLPRLAISNDGGYTWGKAFRVGHPDVTAAKFPSIVGGDEGRIAFLYLGTEAANGTQAAGDDLNNQTWNAYVGFSYDADSADPTIVTTTANDRADPLMRGACNGRCQVNNGGQYDFLDIDINSATGEVWVALVDNCNDHTNGGSMACNDPATVWSEELYMEARGAVGVQTGGWSLREDFVFA